MTVLRDMHGEQKRVVIVMSAGIGCWCTCWMSHSLITCTQCLLRHTAGRQSEMVVAALTATTMYIVDNNPSSLSRLTNICGPLTCRVHGQVLTANKSSLAVCIHCPLYKSQLYPSTPFVMKYGNISPKMTTPRLGGSDQTREWVLNFLCMGSVVR